ncbi:hypothetical protein Hanom_Chr10g00933971 [Helianthus anomalus]
MFFSSCFLDMLFFITDFFIFLCKICSYINNLIFFSYLNKWKQFDLSSYVLD